MDSNEAYITRVHLLAEELKNRGNSTGVAIQRTIPGLLGYSSNLGTANRNELLSIREVGFSIVDYVARAIAGEDPREIADDVPRGKLRRRY